MTGYFQAVLDVKGISIAKLDWSTAPLMSRYARWAKDMQCTI